MESTLAGAALNPLVPFIFDVLRQRYKDRRTIEENINLIRNRLPVIADAIERRQPIRGKEEDEVVADQTEQLRKLAHDIELCTSLFAYRHAKERRDRQRRPVVFTRGTEFARSLQHLVRRLEAAGQLTARLPDPAPASEPDEPGMRLAESTVGTDQLRHLLELVLPSPDESEEQLKAICILGPGGIGKTLLAYRAYINDEVAQQFRPIACVRAADRADEEILRDILTKIQVQGITTTICEQGITALNREEMRKHLLSVLTGTRYLIVIDDMRKVEQMEYIMSAFPVQPNMRCRVIVTTTIQSVVDARIYPAAAYVYKMRTLSVDDSTVLFSREASQDEDFVRTVLDGLRSKCQGLPLALVAIGNLVQQRGLDFCQYIYRDLGSSLETEDRLRRMHWVLAREYTSLGSSVEKARLLYFSTFNSDHPVRRSCTVRRWMAEGFIELQARNSGIPICQQQRSWDTLIDRNITSATGVSNNGRVNRCQASRMLLEYISYKSKVKRLVKFDDHTEWPEPQYYRWLSLHDSEGDFRIPGDSRPRTLVVTGRAGGAVLRFANCELVRVLDLEQCTDVQHHHLTTICKKLLLLRYLSLGVGITVVPREIAYLEYLETLDLKNSNHEVVVPLEVILLPKLKYLIGKLQLNRGAYRASKKKLTQKSNELEILTGFVIRQGRGFAQLMPLMRRLEKVKVWLTSDADEGNLNSLFEAIAKFIRQGTNMQGVLNRSLSIDFQECTATFLASPGFREFLNSLSTARGSLYSLKLRGPAVGLLNANLLSFVTNLYAITMLCLSSTNWCSVSWDAFVEAGLGNLRALQYLKLVAKNIEDDVFMIENMQFKGLKRMSLVVNGRLPPITIQAEALGNLESLHLICPNLDVTTARIQGLKNLKEVALHSGVSEAAKQTWRNVARALPKKPRVLFIEA